MCRASSSLLRTKRRTRSAGLSKVSCTDALSGIGPSSASGGLGQFNTATAVPAFTFSFSAKEGVLGGGVGFFALAFCGRRCLERALALEGVRLRWGLFPRRAVRELFFPFVLAGFLRFIGPLPV